MSPSVADFPWHNRIVGYRMIPVDEITANPRNWRIHPKAQQDALEAAIKDTGYIVPVVNNVQSGYLLDGHLRVALAMRRGETHVPGIDVDLTDEQEATALATIDPISALAVAERDQLESLLSDIRTDQAALATMFADLAKANDIDLDRLHASAGAGAAAGIDDVPDKHMILIECADAFEQRNLLDRFIGEGLKCRALTS